MDENLERPLAHQDAARERIDSALFAARMASPFAAPDSDAQLITDLAQAESVSLTLADRLRASNGLEVVLGMHTQDPTSQRLRGVVARVAADHVVLQLERGLVVARLASIVSSVGLGPGARPPTGLDATWTWRSTMRRWIGTEVAVYVGTAGALRGRLERVGADHFDITSPAGTFAIAWSATASVLNANVQELDPDPAFEV